jgi:hypothetical protein
MGTSALPADYRMLGDTTLSLFYIPNSGCPQSFDICGKMDSAVQVAVEAR